MPLCRRCQWLAAKQDLGFEYFLAQKVTVLASRYGGVRRQ
jgi:hypothetical protein